MSTSNKTSLLLPYYEYFIIMCSLVCFSGVVKCAPTAAKTVVALAYHHCSWLFLKLYTIVRTSGNSKNFILKVKQAHID